MRTDSGGFIRHFKAILGVFEEVELVRNFKSIVGIDVPKHVAQSGIKNLETLIESHKQECLKSINSFQTTIKATQDLLAKCQASGTPPFVCKYIEAMISGMREVVSVRETILKKFESEIIKNSSFSESFDSIQFYLVILSETSGDYLPALAAESVDPRSVATTLEGLKDRLFIEDL